MNKSSLTSIKTLLKMGLLCAAVLVALALTAPSPPLSDAASKQEQAASDMARQQLDQLTQDLAEQHVNNELPPSDQQAATPPSQLEDDLFAPQPLSPQQEAELVRIRNRLMLSEEPLNLVEEPQDTTLDDPNAIQALSELDAQAREQARAVEPYINQELEDRKAQLAAEEARLRLERQSMEQLRDDVESRLAELKALQQAVEEITKLDLRGEEAREDTELSLEERQAKVVQVSKIIAQMKPAPAAQVLERLRNDLVAEVISKISPRVAGKIMAALTPDKAARVSAILARQDGVAQAQINEMQVSADREAAMREAGQVAENVAEPGQGNTPSATQ